MQLRTGCGASDCTTPTCFTCRKRLAGKAPIRRYNPTSARTLAVYLASRENPHGGLCPTLSRSKGPPAAFYALKFSATRRPSYHSEANTNKRSAKQSATASQSDHPDDVSSPAPKSPSRLPQASPDKSHVSVPSKAFPEERKLSPACPRTLSADDVKVTERPLSKDYRSFAATTFGTAAFKMLEWLSPHGVEAISDKVSELRTSGSSKDSRSNSRDAEPITEQPPVSSPSNQPEPSASSDESPSTGGSPKSPLASHTHTSPKLPPLEPIQTHRDSVGSTRNSRTTFRTSSTKSSRKKSLEALSSPVRSEDTKPLSKPPTPNGTLPEKIHWNPKSNTAVIPRGVPEIPTRPAFFENVPTPTVPTQQKPSTNSEDLAKTERPADAEDNARSRRAERRTVDSERPVAELTHPVSQVAEPPANYPLPQALSRLNVELVDFICDVFLEDHTSESSWLGHRADNGLNPEPQNRQDSLIRRRPELHSPLTKQWKAFNEQTLFSVLSDPHSLVLSFTRDGKLYDSHTLWYCMRRLTRVAPSLVFHSLWMAAESLFTPPRSLQTLRSPTRKVFEASRKSLSNYEAGCIMSICLHALVAAAPTVPDSRTLYEMSRIRANGLALAGNAFTARQPPSICLDYDDVFSNDLALRLARRLFCAVTARHIFAEMADVDDKIRDTASELDVLRPLLDQLDLLGTSSIRILEFTQSERLLHETRVPTLLLDWARAVLLEGWDGQAVFSSDSAFGGALSLISTLRKSATYHLWRSTY